jgi:hypothetical protein
MTLTDGCGSVTPILDLEKPFPEALEKRVTGRVAAPFLATVGAIVMTENYAALAIPFGIVLMGFLSTLVHELGHLLAGWSAGLKFDAVTMGPFAIRRSRTGVRVRFTRFWWRGLTYMSFPQVSRLRRRLIVLGAGGPLASLVCGAAALIGGEIVAGNYDLPFLSIVQLFGAYSLLIGILSFRSFRVGPYPGDGMFLRALLRSRDGAKQLVAASALGALRNKTPDGVNWHDRWVRVANDHLGLSTRYHADWYHYSTAQNPETAARFLEECLAGSAFLEPEDRDALVAEAVKFIAWDRNDPDKATRWLTRLRSPENLSRLSTIRMNVALMSASKHFDAALAEWQAGLQLIQQSPPSAAAERYEASWQQWKMDIVRRAAQRLETVGAQESKVYS